MNAPYQLPAHNPRELSPVTSRKQAASLESTDSTADQAKLLTATEASEPHCSALRAALLFHS